MRKFIAVLFLLLCSTSPIHGQKARFGQKAETLNPADFTLKVHISATHIRPYCAEPGTQVGCGDVLYADAILNGRKLEFRGSAELIKHSSVLIIPGDYQARLTKDIHNADSTVIDREFDLLLPDNTVWHCMISGVSE
jgi:hypothetical protein